MGKMSTVFNKGGYATFTAPDKMVVEMLAEFASASDTYLQSDTFHKELVALPNYESVPFWQSSGASFAFADCSKINVEHDDLDNDIEQGGIIAFVHDIENVAAYFGRRRAWEVVNPRSEVVVHGEKAEKGFAVDRNANAEVFYLGSSGTVTLASITHGSATLSSSVAYRGNTIIVTCTPSDGYEVDSVVVGADTPLEKIDATHYAYKATDSNATITVTMKTGYETVQGGFTIMGGEVKDYYAPNDCCVRNFHCGFYVDGEKIEIKSGDAKNKMASSFEVISWMIWAIE